MATEEELQNQLAIALRRISDLEERFTSHIGLDFGRYGVNSPHPNISISTAEYGDGDMRLDGNGIQVKSDNSVAKTGMFFIAQDHELQSEPTDDLPRAQIEGYATEDIAGAAAGQSYLNLWAYDDDGGYARVHVESYAFSDESFIQLLAKHANSNSFSEAPELVVYDVNAGERYVGVLKAPFRLASFTADPTTTLADGDLWYRSDTDELRARINGATYTLLKEGDVAGGATVVVKAADESVTSSTTVQNDDELLFAIAANESWQFEIVLLVTNSGGAEDIRYTVTVPTGATGNYYEPDISTTSHYGVGTTHTVTMGNEQILRIVGSVANGANAGNVTLQWAQGTSGATATTVNAGSYIIARLAS